MLFEYELYVMTLKSSLGDVSSRDRQSVSQLYELVDRLRLTAKDAQNYTDRSLAMSQVTSHFFQYYHLDVYTITC